MSVHDSLSELNVNCLFPGAFVVSKTSKTPGATQTEFCVRSPLQIQVTVASV